jgi:glycosyltransferase involved in cell wall biosynthesis
MRADGISSVLFLSPESPYPLHGGGQYRTASLIHYFSGFAQVDLILISQSGTPALLPPGLVRSQTVIPLPKHGKGTIERYARNARRALLGVPPLIDRLSGLGPAITRAIGGRRYDLGAIEHFWLAPYVAELEVACSQTVLDLHNVESMLHRTCARADHGLVSAGHRRFAGVSRKLEAKLLPRFGTVLAASESDQAIALKIAPGARIEVYPNALPSVVRSREARFREETAARSGPPNVVFSGNFEYHPNIDAVGFLLRDIWPEVRRQRPDLRLRLVGRGDGFVRHLLPPGSAGERGIEVSGPVPDARAEIAAATIVIAPLRMGSGTRIKILEGWAAGRPVVATPLAAEGLAIEDGENIALAGTPHEFARAILRLLGDTGERERLAANGKRTFEHHYTWEVAWRRLDLYLQVTRTTELNRYTERI